MSYPRNHQSDVLEAFHVVSFPRNHQSDVLEAFQRVTFRPECLIGSQYNVFCIGDNNAI
jgi:hypothetical protein